MKTIYKSLSMLVFIIVLAVAAYSQPSNLFYNMGSWKDSSMVDRNVTRAVTLQSVVADTVPFLFNTAVGNFNPKWVGSNADYMRTVNQKLAGSAYYFTTGNWDHDLGFIAQNNFYYTFIVGKNAATNNDMSILETAFNPVNITNVAQSPSTVAPQVAVNITATLSAAKDPGERVFVRYTTDNWTTSSFLEITSFNGSFQGSVAIPGQAVGITVSYYLLSTTQSNPDHASIDYFTLKMMNNNNLNYSYTVTQPPVASATISANPALTETNLNGATIALHLTNEKFGITNLDPTKFFLNNFPAGTTVNTVNKIDSANANVILAFNGTDFDTDSTNASITICFCQLTQGNSLTTNKLTVTAVVEQDISWCNVQWPQNGTVAVGNTYVVYAQVYSAGVTDAPGQGAGIQAWIGYSNTNTNPNTWTNWVAATYNVDAGNNDEYKADIGTSINTADTFYYASRFKLGNGNYFYGGFNSGFWNGTNNVSGQLITTGLPPDQIDWCNLQWPPNGNIIVGASFLAYAQCFEAGVTDTIGQGAGIQAWIGYSSTNTNPNTWTNWVVATYNGDVLNNDEYMADIGTGLPADTFFYASRFRLNSGPYSYGGYHYSAGGFWDGTTNYSDTLVVTILNGINEIAGSASSVFPNPASDWITIKLDENSGEGAIVSITNLLGETVMTEVMDASQKSIYTGNLGKGLYFINARTDKTAFSKPLIIE